MLFNIVMVGCSVVDKSWKWLQGVKKPRAGANVFTSRFCGCIVSVDVDNNKKKKEELWHIHVVSNLKSMPGTLGNAANIGVCFFLPDPSCQPPQLGFCALVL